jgi:hypothetical protein
MEVALGWPSKLQMGASIARSNQFAAFALPKKRGEALNAVPALTWYVLPSGAVIFVNERDADYGVLRSIIPFGFGVDIGAPWDGHISFLQPDDLVPGRDQPRRRRTEAD